jgi:hypothetical protein
MYSPSPLAWCVGRRTLAVLAIALAALIASELPSLWSTRPIGGVAIAMAIVGTVFVLLLTAGAAGLAWRLWSRWNTATVRLAVGTAVALVALFLASKADALAKAFPVLPSWADAISSLATLALLVAAAVAYRWLTDRVIRRAGLADPLDPYGQPWGRSDRLRWFARILGLATFLAASQLLVNFENRARGPGPFELALLLIPMALGWTTYKLFIWRMVPTRSESLPVGGFEVVTSATPHDDEKR